MRNEIYRRQLTRFGILAGIVMTFAFVGRALPQDAPEGEGAPVAVTGSNGRVATFLGIKAASAKGITVQMVADGPLKGITWEQLDLQKMETENPVIFSAYEAAKYDGKNTDLNLGTFFDPNAPKPVSKRNPKGWYETSTKGKKFVMQMPNGRAKGILLVSLGNYGNSVAMVPRNIPEVGIFGELQKKYKLAIMAYHYEFPSEIKPGEIDDYVFPEKGSGEAVLTAIKNFSSDSENPELEMAPIVIYGTGRVGAAFAYNFTQWKPERIVAAVVSSGAFYTQPATEASVKVPVLFQWGEYDDVPDYWGATHLREEVMKKHAEMKPNWMSAMEFRGNDFTSGIHRYFGFEFLNQMIKRRLPEGGGIVDLPAEKSWVGNFEGFEIDTQKNPDAIIGENQTWIPDRDMAKMWQAYGRGELEARPLKR